jgi:hypothetical protein
MVAFPLTLLAAAVLSPVLPYPIPLAKSLVAALRTVMLLI